MTANPSDPTSVTELPSLDLAEGQKLAGCYLLRRRVDAGDDSIVWLAHDEVLGKDISLHFVPQALRSDARTMSELRQEVKRNRQLIHPNIVRVHDLIEESEWAAVSMDPVPAESLAAILKNKHGSGFAAADVAPWIRQLAHTLEDAHKINLTHRDLAPANLYLDPAGKLLVSSFGISRCIHEALGRGPGGKDAHLAYLSPQQIDGQAATRADDIYSLGVLSYELLTGEVPFSGADLAGQIRTSVPARMSERLSELGRKEAGVDPSLDEAIAACLQKAPTQRPSRAADIASALASVEVLSPAPPPREFEKAEVSAEANEPVSEEVPAVPVETAEPVEMPAPVEPEKPVAAPRKKFPELVAEMKAARKVEATSESSGGKQPAKPASPFKRPASPEDYANLRPKRRRISAFGVAAALVAIGLAGYYFKDVLIKHDGTQPPTDIATTEQAYGFELTSVTNKIEPEPSAPLPAKSVQPTPVEPVLLAAAPRTPKRPATPAPTPPTPTPAATPPVPAAAVSSAEVEAIDKNPAVAEKVAALEKLKAAAQAADQAHQNLLKQHRDATSGIAELQKSIEQKTRDISPLKRETDDLVKQRKQKEDAQKAAELEARKAQQVAAEKSRVAEEATKALAAMETQNKERLAAQEKADAEIQSLQKILTDKQRAASALDKAVTDSMAARQQQAATLAKAEQDAELARAAVSRTMIVENARKAREEADRVRDEKGKERQRIEKEIVEMKKMFDDKMKVLEAAQKAISEAETKSKDSEAIQKRAEEEARKALPAAPSSSRNPAPDKASAPTSQVTPVAEKPPTPELIADADKAALPSATLAMKTEPTKLPPAVTPPPPNAGGENSLGMKFAPVGDVSFCIWQTRVRDFEAFATAVNMKSTVWKGPGFKQGSDHPVVNVTWQEAIAFCKWLTDKEHKDGTLPATNYYRLATDSEWSAAVGLPEESGKTPEARDMGVPDVYPWGTQWPPPQNAGNYTGEETGSDVAIKGYNDGFAWTSPVGTFPPNKYGLYDMGGNVWQWVMDSWNADVKHRVLRGASWYNGALKLSLLSSCRVHAAPDSCTDNYGFRIVRATEAQKSVRK